jgi:hypothetical protein
MNVKTLKNLYVPFAKGLKLLLINKNPVLAAKARAQLRYQNQRRQCFKINSV